MHREDADMIVERYIRQPQHAISILQSPLSAQLHRRSETLIVDQYGKLVNDADGSGSRASAPLRRRSVHRAELRLPARLLLQPVHVIQRGCASTPARCSPPEPLID
jgi:hypothetical protein